MTWTDAAPAGTVAVLVVLVPGLAVAVAARLRGVVALGLAGAFGYALIGASGVLAAALRVPFGVPALLGTTAVAVVVVVALRLLAGALGRPVPAWDSWRPAAWVPAAVAAAAASAVVAGIAFAHVPSPERISQTYDAVFHLNAVASIVGTGDASSLHLYRLTHVDDAVSYYPAVWHSIAAIVVQVTGVPVPVAANAAWIGTAGPVFALSSAFASAVLFGAAGLRREAAAPVQRTLVAATGALLSSAFVAFPYLLLDFGVLYPNGLAYTILPIGVALIAVLLPWPASAAWRPEVPESVVRTVLLGVVWLAAAGFAHPRSLAGVLVLSGPLVIAWFAARMSALAAGGERGRRRARRGWLLAVGGTVALLAVGAIGVYHYYDLATRPISDHLNGRPARASETLPVALLQGLLATSLARAGGETPPLPPSVLLAVVAFAGLIAAALRPGLRWAPVSYLAVVLLYGLAAGSDGDLAKVATGLWDKDKFRILAMLPMIGVPLVAWTVCAGTAELVATMRARSARRGDPRPRTVVAAVAGVALVVAAATWSGPALSGVSTAIGQQFRLPDSTKHGELIDADQVALLQQVGRFVPEGQVIAANPWSGSALAWALGGRETLFPHLGGYWGEDRILLRKHLDDWRTEPEVCPVVRRLDLHWVLTDSGRFAGDRKAFKSFQSVPRAVVEKGGGELVARSGSARLWRLTACWE